MDKRVGCLLVMIVFFVSISGCSSIGVMPHVTGTQTDLSKKNYRIVKSAVRGVDSGFYLFGIIPIDSPSYAHAMADLHKKVKMEGEAMALVNVAQDHSTLYLLLFSIPKVTITADVIEFTEEKTEQKVRDLEEQVSKLQEKEAEKEKKARDLEVKESKQQEKEVESQEVESGQGVGSSEEKTEDKEKEPLEDKPQEPKP